MRNRLREPTTREEQRTYAVKADKRLAGVVEILLAQGYNNPSELFADALYRMVNSANPGATMPTLEGVVDPTAYELRLTEELRLITSTIGPVFR